MDYWQGFEVRSMDGQEPMDSTCITYNSIITMAVKTIERMAHRDWQYKIRGKELNKMFDYLRMAQSNKAQADQHLYGALGILWNVWETGSDES